MSDMGLAKGYSALVGVVLVVVGLLGFIGNPIVGEPASNPLFVTGTIHNVVHLATGLLALYIAYMLTGVNQANGVIAFGALYIVILVLTLISGNLFGILGNDSYKVNTMDHVLHAVLGVASLAVGYMARNQTAPQMR
jgi:hypothetical protein